MFPRSNHSQKVHSAHLATSAFPLVSLMTFLPTQSIESWTYDEEEDMDRKSISGSPVLLFWILLSILIFTGIIRRYCLDRLEVILRRRVL